MVISEFKNIFNYQTFLTIRKLLNFFNSLFPHTDKIALTDIFVLKDLNYLRI